MVRISFLRKKRFFSFLSNLVLSVCSITLFSACGYCCGSGTLVDRYHSFSVSCVDGDTDGTFTSSLIHEMVSQSPLAYCQSGGNIFLQVKILDIRDQNIGFRYDRDKEGCLTDRVIPTESRLFATAQLCVKDQACCKTIIGPILVSTHVAFDHDYYSSRNGINVFSLGQLANYDAARDNAQRVLNEALAKKIVEYVIQSW